MAVVSVKISHNGWTGTFTKGEIPTFNVVYLVEVDDPEDGNLLVVDASGIPKIGSAYSVGQDFHAGVRCKSLSTSPVAGTRNLWQVTASFGTKSEEDPNDGFDQDGKPTDDPLKFAVSMSLSSTRVVRDAIQGVYMGQMHDVNGLAGILWEQGFMDGNVPPAPQNNVGVLTDHAGRITNARAITNSVFTPFDPPVQTEYNRTVIRIKFNTLNSPKRILPYINSINSKQLNMLVSYRWADEFGQDRASFGTFQFPKFTGRIMGISTTPARRNGISYHENNLEIEVDKLYTWRLDILDRGYATMNYPKTAKYKEGTGVVVTDAVVSDDGFANREPVLLNGSGQQLNVEEADNAVYLRYGVYPEMDWNRVGLQQPSRLQGHD